MVLKCHKVLSILHNTKTCSETKRLGPDCFSAEFYKSFKEELIWTLLKLFHEIEKEDCLSHSMKPVLHSHKTRQRHIQKGELQTNLLNEHLCKNPQLNNGRLNPTTNQKGQSPQPSWLHPRDAGIYKSINII
jgi:hypothetical protein